MATHECITCELISCLACINSHVSKPRFSHHKISLLAKSRNLICLDHFAPFEFFCTVEKVQLCSHCIDKHTEHYVISNDQAEIVLQTDLKEGKSKIKKILETVVNDKEKYLQDISTIQESENLSIDELEEFCEKCASELKDFQNESQKNIKNLYKSLKINASSRINSLSIIEFQIKNLLSEASAIEFLEKSYPLLNIKPSTEKLSLPKLGYSNFQLPCLNISSASKNLYYLNRGTREFYTYNIYEKELVIRELSQECQNISRWSSFITLSDGRIFVTGGKIERNSGSHRTCMFIDPVSLKQCMAPPMLNGHSSHISIRILNKVYVISGKNEDNVCDSFCEFFDCYTETWTQIGKINFPRTCAAGTYVTNFIYVMGGFQNSVCNSIEKYNLNTNVWTLLPTVLPEKIWQHGCFALDSSKILIFGGEKESEEPNKVSYIYDTGNNNFCLMTSIDSIPVYLYFWIQVIRDGDYLYSINKEKTLVKYAINENKWMQIDLA